MNYNLRSSTPRKDISPSAMNREMRKDRKTSERKLYKQAEARPAPGKMRKKPDPEKSQKEEVKKSSDNSETEQECAINSLNEFLLQTFIVEWSIKDLNYLDELVEVSGLLEHMPGQLEVFYWHAFKKRMDLERPQLPFKNNKDKLEKYVDMLVDEHHFNRFYRMSTFDTESDSVSELPWVVSKLLWLRLTGFERHEDHRAFGKARMNNKSKAVPISQLRHRKEPEEIPWNIINEMEALLQKLPRYRPEDSISKPIEEAFGKLKAVVENQDTSAYQTGNIRCANSSSSGRGSTTLVDEPQENYQQQSPESDAEDMEL